MLDAFLSAWKEENPQRLLLQTKSCQMKTTVVILTVEGARWQWAYAGDSRLYHFVEGNLLWQTRDHSSSQIAVLLWQIAPEQIRFHEDRSRIYRALGQDEDTQVDAGEEALSPGEHQFLLCSDGFWEYILEREMEGQLKASATPQEWLDRMCSLLRERVPDNNDNNSAAAVWVGEPSRWPALSKTKGSFPLAPALSWKGPWKTRVQSGRWMDCVSKGPCKIKASWKR